MYQFCFLGLQATELEARAGSIQAAINLEVLANRISGFDLRVEGLNGQLPNLDLFNLAARLCRVEGFTVMLHEKVNLTSAL